VCGSLLQGLLGCADAVQAQIAGGEITVIESVFRIELDRFPGFFHRLLVFAGDLT
jgi:hypothetical protein